ncbi:MAG: hypothetical protein NTX12_00245 [Actinobacteria bacterium]|nr:hypothetical protein [Actinomycetota bacterium]
MKRWFVIGIPLAILIAILFVKPPTFTSHKSTENPSVITNTTGAKPSIAGGGDEEDDGLVNGQKPAYGGSQKDNYDKG